MNRLTGVTSLALALLTGCTTYVREVPMAAQDILRHTPAQYDGPDDGPWHQRELVARFVTALPPGVAGQCRHLPALDRAAAAMATTFSVNSAPLSAGLTQWVLWSAGSPAGPVTRQGMWRWSGHESPFPDDIFVPLASSLTARDVPCAYGFADVEWAPVQHGLAGIVIREPIQFDPFPRHVSPGAPLDLAGHVVALVRNVKAYADDDGLRVRELPIALEADGRFHITIPMPSSPGRAFVTIMGEPDDCRAKAGFFCLPHHLASFPIDVGVDPQDQPDELVRHPKPNPDDAATWPGVIVASYNEVRARLNLPPLDLLPAASQLASRNASILVAHPDAPADRSVRAKLRETHPEVATVHQQSSRFELVSELVAEQLQDPAERRRIVDPAIRYLGIGIAPAKKSYRVVQYFVTTSP